MLLLIVCAAILSMSAAAVIQGDEHQSSSYRGLKGFKVLATWDEAQETCRAEGAYLASPISADLLNDMKYFLNESLPSNKYFIGTRAWQTPGKYVSVEGIALENMPVFNMLGELDPAQGDCLCMDEHRITVVSCSTPLPYICHLNDTMTNNTSDAIETFGCGIEGYRYDSSMSRCYKYHEVKQTWDDAEDKCKTEGGHLLVMNDNNEANVIQSMYPIRDGTVWVGHRNRTPGSIDWISIDGTPTEELYDEWYGGYKPTSVLSNCGTIVYNGTLANNDCPKAFSFICEKQPDHLICRSI